MVPLSQGSRHEQQTINQGEARQKPMVVKARPEGRVPDRSHVPIARRGVHFTTITSQQNKVNIEAGLGHDDELKAEEDVPLHILGLET